MNRRDKLFTTSRTRTSTSSTLSHPIPPRTRALPRTQSPPAPSYSSYWTPILWRISRACALASSVAPALCKMPL